MCDCKVKLERLERWADKVETALRDLSRRTQRDTAPNARTNIPSLLDEKFGKTDNECRCPCHYGGWTSCIYCAADHPKER